MPASIRIIKIVKDKNPIDGSEAEAYTAEIECEAEDAKDLEKELLGCPYGEQIMALLKRADFIPEGPQGTAEELAAEAKEEAEALKTREEELREEGRKEVRNKYIEFLKSKRMKRATEALENLADKEEEAATKEEVEREQELEREEAQRDHDGQHSLMLSHA